MCPHVLRMMFFTPSILHPTSYLSPNNPLTFSVSPDKSRISPLSFKMVPQTISLVVIISLYLVLIQRIAGQSDCTSDEIQNNNLGACVCHGGNSACGTVKCPVTPPGLKGTQCPTKLDSQVVLKDCDSSCAGENKHGCVGCWIWF
jgi:hypothetical protein